MRFPTRSKVADEDTVIQYMLILYPCWRQKSGRGLLLTLFWARPRQAYHVTPNLHPPNLLILNPRWKIHELKTYTQGEYCTLTSPLLWLWFMFLNSGSRTSCCIGRQVIHCSASADTTYLSDKLEWSNWHAKNMACESITSVISCFPNSDTKAIQQTCTVLSMLTCNTLGYTRQRKIV